MLKTSVNDEHAQYESVRMGSGGTVHMRKNDRVQLNEHIKEMYLTCNQSLSSCYGSAQTFLQFEVETSEIDKMKDMYLLLNVTNGSGSGTAFHPTFYWFDRIEIYCGGKLLFTRYPDPNLIECVLTKGDNWIVNNYSALAITSANINTVYFLGSTVSASSTADYIVPIMDEFQQSNVPLSLCKKITYKVYLPPGTSIQTTTDTITLNSASLYIKYSQADVVAGVLLRKHHTHSKVIPIVNYEYFQKTYATTTSGTRITEQLINSRGNVAGLLYLLRRTGTAYLQTLIAIADHSVLNDTNSPIGVRNYKSACLLKDESEQFSDTRLFRSLNFYFKSFCSYPDITLKHSSDTGGLDFSDNFKLEINPATSSNPVELVVYTYKYGYLVIEPDGSLRVVME